MEEARSLLSLLTDLLLLRKKGRNIGVDQTLENIKAIFF